VRASGQTASAAEPRNRWLILGIAATAALALLVALSLTGVLDRGSSRRDAVARYIQEVNAVQRSEASARQRVTNTYSKARSDPRGLAGSVPQLRRSVASLRAFDRELRALRPPADAAALHRRLIAMSAAEWRFAQQIALLGAYLPVVAKERQGVAQAGATLKLNLRSTKGTAAQAAAFDRFARRVTAAIGPLRTATPPSTLEPVRDQELAQMGALAATARKLSAAVRAKDAADAQLLLQQLAVVAAGKGNAVERSAIIAFDDQAREVNRLRLAVAKERARLDGTLR
jgi:hypothetical protein